MVGTFGKAAIAAIGLCLLYSSVSQRIVSEKVNRSKVTPRHGEGRGGACFNTRGPRACSALTTPIPRPSC
jgi:hypothetical protein